MSETSGSLATIGKYREELQRAVNGQTVCSIVTVCLPLSLSPHPYMVLPVSQSL